MTPTTNTTRVCATFSLRNAQPSSFRPQSLAKSAICFKQDLALPRNCAFCMIFRSAQFALEPFTPADVHRCGVLLQTHADLKLGLADATVISTAERLGIRRIFT